MATPAPGSPTVPPGPVLVLGASGFLGSHVTRLLVEAGREVRILVRATSDTRATDDLDLDRRIGDLLDRASLDRAMDGCGSVFHCAVDTRAWLRDPTPLFRVNVDGLASSMDAALAAGVRRFVFTSSFVTIGRGSAGPATEDDGFAWDDAPAYVRSRVEAEERFLACCRERGLPGVACCVANTYGPRDVAPTPHGKLVADVARGRMAWYWEGGGPTVGIVDAARALLLAEERGRVGERYIVAERRVAYEELFRLAADAAGVAPPRKRIPVPLLEGMAAIAETVARVRGCDTRFTRDSIRCSRIPGELSNAKAREELGWDPRPIEASIREAVDDYLGRSGVSTR